MLNSSSKLSVGSDHEETGRASEHQKNFPSVEKWYLGNAWRDPNPWLPQLCSHSYLPSIGDMRSSRLTNSSLDGGSENSMQHLMQRRQPDFRDPVVPEQGEPWLWVTFWHDHDSLDSQPVFFFLSLLPIIFRYVYQVKYLDRRIIVKYTYDTNVPLCLLRPKMYRNIVLKLTYFKYH